MKEFYMMCELADEVQQQAPDWSDCGGAHFFCSVCKNACIEDNGLHFCHDHIELHPDYIWAPNQRSLQAMAREENENDYALSKRFTEFIPGHKESTMDQLWLQFVMEKKFNKVWKDGLKWQIL